MSQESINSATILQELNELREMLKQNQEEIKQHKANEDALRKQVEVLSSQTITASSVINATPSTSGLQTNASNVASLTSPPSTSAAKQQQQQNADEPEQRVIANPPTQVMINAYNDQLNSGAPEKWIKRFEFITNNAEWNDQHKAVYLPNYLEGKAIRWFNNSNIDTWNELKAAFITHFQQDEADRTAFVNMKFNPVRGNISGFIEKKINMAASAGIPEKELIENVAIYSGLPMEESRALAIPLPTSVSELKSRVQRLVQIRNNADQSAPSSFKPNFNKFNQGNPNQRYTPYNPHKKPYYNSRSHMYNKQNTPHQKQHNPYYKPRYPQHNTQPMYKNKPYKPCPCCRDMGKIKFHWLSDCPHKQKQNTQKKAVNTLEQEQNNNLN